MSNSSMKISSKSLLSPGHHHGHEQPSSAATLSASLSRRLRTNRSLRGAQSPMFPSGKMRGTRQLDNPEPSSPKVTCIGQVRVKTRKKQGNRNLHRTLSRNRGGEVSFRGVDKNQRWVHLPLTICEALRAFGSEFSCLFPCRAPSCLSNDERDKVEESQDRSSCGAVFARWLVAVDGGKREIELVVGGEEEEVRERGFRRHGVGEIELELKAEQGRVSVCVPPKNALLLMRCRSDPLRVNALANRLFECPLPTGEDDDEEEEDREDGNLERKPEVKGIDSIFVGETNKIEKLSVEKPRDEDDKVNPLIEIEKDLAVEVKYGVKTEDLEVEKMDINGEILKDAGDKLEDKECVEADVLSDFSSGSVEETEEFVIGEIEESEIGKTEELVIEKTENLTIRETKELVIGEKEELPIATEEFPIPKTEDLAFGETRELETEEIEKLVIEDDLLIGEEFQEERRTSRYSCSSVLSLHLEIAERETETELETETVDPQFEEMEDKEIETETRRDAVLPDCLLLMRYEPKLSMEVSKETWVRSTDFLRRLPKRQPKVNKIKGHDNPKKGTAVDSYVPPRSSCSFPAPPPVSMAALIEQRLMTAAAYEPFVLTRCKSEPMRTAAAKLMPEPCFWNGGKLEPHRSANFSVGAAGIGF